jgi:hypothetical protein
MAYNWLRLGMGSTIGRLWAPAAVIALVPVAAHLQSTIDLWWLMHIFGGAALAFYFSRWMPLVALSFACTGALAWEAGEFALDQVAGTTLQQGNLDTMSDLLLSVCGAAAYLSFAALWRGRGGR